MTISLGTMTVREMILSYTRHHQCEIGLCGGGHGYDMIEFPSVIFVDACAMTIESGEQGLPPD